MKIEVNINDEMFDRAIIESLKEAYKMNCDPNQVEFVDDEFLNAVDLVISYYTNHEQYQAWVNEKINFTK